jgi:hypothetical protein
LNGWPVKNTMPITGHIFIREDWIT